MKMRTRIVAILALIDAIIIGSIILNGIVLGAVRVSFVLAVVFVFGAICSFLVLLDYWSAHNNALLDIATAIDLAKIGRSLDAAKQVSESKIWLRKAKQLKRDWTPILERTVGTLEKSLERAPLGAAPVAASLADLAGVEKVCREELVPAVKLERSIPDLAYCALAYSAGHIALLALVWYGIVPTLMAH